MFNQNETTANNLNGHYYSLALVAYGVEKDIDTLYSSRQAAEKQMHKLMKRYGVRLLEEYDDNHDKTYVCDRNVRFFITRAW